MIYLLALFLFIVTLAATYFVATRLFKSSAERISATEAQAATLLNSTQAEIAELKEKIQQSAKSSAEKIKENEQKSSLQQEKITRNLEVLEAHSKLIEEANLANENQINQLNGSIASFKDEMRTFHQHYLQKLSQHFGQDIASIKENLLAELQEDLSLARQTRINKMLENLESDKVVMARNLLVEAVYRFSSESSVEKKTSVIPVSREETKVKLIGKNAEIIRLIEDKTGVNIIFEEGRKGILITHYDLVRRHWARETVIKLMRDKQLDLSKVMRRLKETAQETKKLLVEIGGQVVRKLDMEYRQFPDEFKEILGRLKFRTSYGQNILRHCFEVGYFTLMMGNELNLNQEVCKIGGFFHDLGKAIDQEDGRPHDILTKEIMERFNFSWEEIHAAWTHHDSVPIETPEALLVKAADALSAGRPGARQETLEKYLARIMALESIAKSYAGVNKTFAISGGRELRVLLDHKQVLDQNMSEMANQIAAEIEANVAYPGQIKVNLIRRVQYYKTAKNKKTLTTNESTTN